MKKIAPYIETIGSGLLMIAGLITNNPWIFIASIVFGGYSQTKEGILDTIENRHLNVELLMILSAVGSCLIGYYSEGAILIFIFSLSKMLETMTTDQSKKQIRSLMTLQPTNASRLLANGQTEKVDVSDLVIGDLIVVAVGETIPIDATIKEGTSSIEEAAITGESLPVQKTVDDVVFGGTLNVSHPITLTVTHELGDTVIQKIVRMVEESQKFPSKTARFIDKLEDIYARVVLIVVALVIIAGMIAFGQTFEEAFYRGMILLVVASPCALIASVTPATLAAISNGARHGVLVKGGIHFENMMDTEAVVFDKTGTLTNGIPTLKESCYISDDDLETKKAIIALETYSSHPLANAIIAALQKEVGEDVLKAEELEEIAGNGIQGKYNSSFYKVGKKDMMTQVDEKTIALGESWAKEGMSIVYVERDGKTVAVLGLVDEVREDSKALITWLNNHNIETIMITGDTRFTAEKIGESLGIKQIIAETLPQEKAEKIQELRETYPNIVMVGDGINDAPALANATIGIALGSGTDVAIETADMILVNNRVSSIRYIYELSQKLRKIIIQNVIFSVAVILLLVVSNLFGYMTLPIGVVGHEGSTILVIINSLRMLRLKGHED